MNKFLLVALVGISCFVFAHCNEKFHEEWKEYMSSHYCGEEATDEMKEKYITCCELLPEDMKTFLYEKTETDNMIAAQDKLCTDMALAEQICGELQETMEEKGMTEEKVEEMLTCKNE